MVQHYDSGITADLIECGPTLAVMSRLLVEDARLRRLKCIRDLEDSLAVICERFGSARELESIRGLEIMEWQAEISKYSSPSTVNKLTSRLRQLFRVGQLYEVIERAPLIRQIPVGDNVRRRVLSKEEVLRIVAASPEWLADMVRLGYVIGWRRMALQRLGWQCWNREDGTLHLCAHWSKNAQRVVVPVVGEIEEVIMRRVRRRVSRSRAGTRAGEPIFHRGDGKPIKSFRNAWLGALARSGVENAVFHDLRRCAVTNLIKAGVPQEVAKKITGHKSDICFSRYDIAELDATTAALEKLPRLVSTPVTQAAIKRLRA